MSVKSEIQRIETNISSAFAAVEEMGGTAGTSSDDLANSIRSIPTGGDSATSNKFTLIGEFTPDSQPTFQSGKYSVFYVTGYVVNSKAVDGVYNQLYVDGMTVFDAVCDSNVDGY